MQLFIRINRYMYLDFVQLKEQWLCILKIVKCINSIPDTSFAVSVLDESEVKNL